MTRRCLFVYTADDVPSRGMLLISALHFAAPRLRNVEVCFLYDGSPAVSAAIESLVWDTGLHATVADGRSLSREALGLVAIATYDPLAIPAVHQASAMGVPVIVPIQFPSQAASAEQLRLASAAHDPRALADEIVRLVRLREPA